MSGPVAVLLLAGLCVPFGRLEFHLIAGGGKQAAGAAFALGAALSWAAAGLRRAFAAGLARGKPLVASLWIGAALILLWAWTVTDVRAGAAAATLLLLAGSAYAVGGRALLRRLAPAFGFALFTIPVPGFVLDRLTVLLLEGATRVSAALLGAMFGPVTRHGYGFYLPGGALLTIVEDCSGLGGLMLLPPLAVFAALFPRPLGRSRTLCLLGASVPLALAANLGRVLVTGWALERRVPWFLEGAGHTVLGLGTLALAIAVLFALAGRFRSRRRAPGGPVPRSNREVRADGCAATTTGAGASPPTARRPATGPFPAGPILGLLAAGNILLYASAAALPRAGRPALDLKALAARIQSLWPRADWHEARFPPSNLLPRTYLYLEGGRPADAGFVSVYAGYFPMTGLLREEPHDPTLCYRVQGWSLPSAPRRVVLAGGHGTLVVSRITIRASRWRRDVFYWAQEPGRYVDPSEPSWRTWFRRLGRLFREARSDLVWVRVEVAGGAAPEPLDTEWRTRLRALAAAVDESFLP